MIAGVDLGTAGRKATFDGGDPPGLHADIETGAAVGQAGVADDQIESAHGRTLARTRRRVSMAVNILSGRTFMPDLFPTTGEAEKDKALELGIVNHLGPDSFKPDGMRPFFEYRQLGLDKLTGGRVGALVARARPGTHPDAPR